MSHYIVAGGTFENVCVELVGSGREIAYVEVWHDESGKKAASKTKYACPTCGVNAWAKPNVSIVCGNAKKQWRQEYETPDANYPQTDQEERL